MFNKSYGKSKHQNTKSKQIPMTEIQNMPIRHKHQQTGWYIS